MGVISDTCAQWNHFVTNFKKELYGRGLQTWQISSYDNNYFYFANKNGLLEYNGSDWKLFQLNNQNDARSVHISKRQHRIYIGGVNEFGYLEPDATGHLIYTRQSDAITNKYSLSGGYWGIYEVDNILYYVSDRYIVKQIGDEFTLIESDSKIDCSALVNNVLFLGTFDGIKILVGNTLLPLPNGDSLKGKTIRGIIPYEKGTLIATALDGLFISNEDGIRPFVTGHEDFMRRNELFSLAVSDRYLAIGTIHKGLLLLDRSDFSAQYYNEDNGLQNNTVLSLYFDNRQNIWLGLDNGIDYIATDSPLTNLYTYPNSKGAGYASLIADGKIYLGTNRGLFYTEWPVRFTEKGANLQLIPELSGQVWELATYNNEIFCMHDKGLFIIKGNKVDFIPELRGAIHFTSHETDPDKCWISTYDSFFLLQKKNGKWSVLKQIPEIQNWLKNLVFESPEVLWVRRLNTRMERIVLDTADYRIKESRSYAEKDGFASMTNLYAYKVKKNVYFTTDSGIYLYDKNTDRIVESKAFKDAFIKGTIVLAEQENKLYGLSSKGIQTSTWNAADVLSHPNLFQLSRSRVDFIRYYETMDVINDSLVIIPNEYGFALLNTARPARIEENDLYIKSVSVTYPKDSLIYENNYLNKALFPKIDFKNNAIRIAYDVRSFGQDKPVTFRYKLSPDPLWSAFTSSTLKEYNNLKEGDYTFDLEAFYADGGTGVTKFSFIILPPWYRSVYAWVVYCLLFLGFVRLVYLFEERRITYRKEKELTEKEQEIRLLEQEFTKEDMRKEQRIIELKNENLEQELKHKSQEMANLMMNFSRKNETLMNIKQELYKVMGEMKGDAFAKPKRMIVSLNNQIDSNIQSDDMLKKFEEQFDLVHNKYISRIKKHYPDLHVGELKMCAYLKMNLSSKEIAPLLNLSVRGVETLRYRLRKKLGLNREDNLIEHLNNLKD
jgi:hypothetical protein